MCVNVCQSNNNEYNKNKQANTQSMNHAHESIDNSVQNKFSNQNNQFPNLNHQNKSQKQNPVRFKKSTNKSLEESNKYEFDFSKQYLNMRNEYASLRLFNSKERVIMDAFLGSVILSIVADSKDWPQFEAYKRAVMAMHGVGCGNVCSNANNLGIVIIFIWLVAASASANNHENITQQQIHYDNDMKPMTTQQFVADLTISGAFLTAVKQKNKKITWNQLFDGIFEAQDKFARFGFNQLGDKPDAAENVYLSFGIQFWSSNIMKYISDFKISNMINEQQYKIIQGNEKFDSIVNRTLNFTILLRAYIITTFIGSLLYASTFKSRKDSLVESQQLLWHLSNKMGNQHIPENRTEKAFIILQTTFTTNLANSVYLEFEFLLNYYIGKSKSFMIWVVSYLCFVLIKDQGTISVDGIVSSLLGMWDLGTSTGNGNIWPKYMAGKLLIMILQQPTRYSTMSQFEQRNKIHNEQRDHKGQTSPDDKIEMLRDQDYMKCYDQVLKMITSNKIDKVIISENKYCDNMTISKIIVDGEEINNDIVVSGNDGQVDSNKLKDVEPVESFKKNMITQMAIMNDENKIPIIKDDESSTPNDIPIITDEDSIVNSYDDKDRDLSAKSSSSLSSSNSSSSLSKINSSSSGSDANYASSAKSSTFKRPVNEI